MNINSDKKVSILIFASGNGSNAENLIKYFKKRKYLDGFKTYLVDLEKQGKIEIIQDQRSYIGSMLIDGYSIIAWRTKNA